MKIIFLLSCVVIFLIGILFHKSAFAQKGLPKHLTDTYVGLRERAFKQTASELRVEPTPNGVFGVLMETAYPEAVVTLITLLTGDVSLYFSNGGGLIGGIAHEGVKKAALDFNNMANTYVSDCALVSSFPLPSPGKTIFYFLTTKGICAREDYENKLAKETNPLSPLFYSGQEVITQFRLAEEKIAR